MLALTMGDPAGIGPEISLKAWRRLRHTGPAFVLLSGCGANVGSIAEAAAGFADVLPVLALPADAALRAPVRAGRPDPANAATIAGSIAEAVRLAMRGEVDGIVTNPIAKSVLKQAGFPHPGHTEYLAALAGASGSEAMLLASPLLRVVPVTVHVSLREALDTLTEDAIVRVSLTTADALRRDFGIARPRLAVAGLNPHAGEAGHMGSEETMLIAPAIARLRAAGLDVAGPLPPDTMFTEAARPGYDAAICMYHDQALIPLKTLDMRHGVNVTIGLELVRTSPDHGTAFDIAGQDRADPESLVAAIRLAGEIVRNRRASCG